MPGGDGVLLLQRAGDLAFGTHGGKTEAQLPSKPGALPGAAGFYQGLHR